jgi:hypothetical protein
LEQSRFMPFAYIVRAFDAQRAFIIVSQENPPLVIWRSRQS